MQEAAIPAHETRDHIAHLTARQAQAVATTGPASDPCSLRAALVAAPMTTLPLTSCLFRTPSISLPFF